MEATQHKGGRPPGTRPVSDAIVEYLLRVHYDWVPVDELARHVHKKDTRKICRRVQGIMRWIRSTHPELIIESRYRQATEKYGSYRARLRTPSDPPYGQTVCSPLAGVKTHA